MDQIKTVVDGRLWISEINSIFRRPFRVHEIDYNLNLAFKPIGERQRIADATYDQIAFPDEKAGPEMQSQFDKAVSTTVRRVQETDDRIVVNCGAGVSRSAAVVITTVAVVEDISFKQALEHVSEARPVIDPFDTFRQYGRTYL